jgi:hypothetical protein
VQSRPEQSAFEERTEKSTAGSPTVYSRTRGFGKLKLEQAPYIVSRCSQGDKPRAEEAVGKDPKGIAASGENNCVTAPVKRTMSAAARRKIAAAQRARWAKFRAAKKKAA